MLKDLPPVSIRLAGTTVHESTTVKNHGIVMDRNLSFHSHVSHVVSKSTGLLLALTHVRHVLPKPAVKPIVISFVMSMVRYFLSIYGTCGAKERRRLPKVSIFVPACMISGHRKWDHISDVLAGMKWLSAENLTLYHRICCIRRIVTTGHPSIIAETLMSHVNHGHDTCNARRFRLPKMRTEAGRR